MSTDHIDTLTLAGNQLRAAREQVSEATLEARNATRKARRAGMTEVLIAATIGVDRNTVRAWLGKPRQR